MLRFIGFILAFVAGSAHAGTFTETAKSGGFDRTWYVHVPPSYQPGHPLPLVIVYHGSGGSGDKIESRIGLDAVADRLGFIAVYPDGISTVWAGGLADEADAAGVDDVAFTATLLDRLEAEYSIDRQHVVAAGFSNGAHLVHLLGCRLADRFTAIVPVGGTMASGSDCHPSRPITVIEFHDSRDPVNSYRGGRAGINGAGRAEPVIDGIGNWALRDKCRTSASPTRFPATGESVDYHVNDFPGCPGGIIVRLYTLHNGTHAWPRVPDASAMIGELVTGEYK
ncbi:MAG TPA: PHB depolymerase family esterase [Gammaproteobacteria bacterium]|nr:PHB depolymerase family esterase [Gammaproteobacteria bacterium]